MSSWGTYSCRRMYGREDQKPSEHAFATALDVGEVTLKDGRRLNVKDSWFTPGPASDFFHRLRDEGCVRFGTVLSPDYNVEHADHLHFDMGNWDFCPKGPPEPATPEAAETKGETETAAP